jgi:uncharacterized protein YqhQ
VVLQLRAFYSTNLLQWYVMLLVLRDALQCVVAYVWSYCYAPFTVLICCSTYIMLVMLNHDVQRVVAYMGATAKCCLQYKSIVAVCNATSSVERRCAVCA